ncbi:MAG: rhodanese-related sulfurtransferase [Leptolyngbyaceae cyanobacterium SM1_1_3]|nr:rhodanese-related sulfurtransferase [Leptolyngbyaceae cyanobacterium SM1_1_3]
MTASGNMGQIDVAALAERLAQAEELQLIDVREANELAIARLEGFEHLPLSQFKQWAEQIQARFDPSAETIVMCHHGMRSAQMCQWLIAQGFTQVKNLTGGIDAYADKLIRP